MADLQFVALRLRDGTVAAVVARAALELHLLAAVVARSGGHPGFVSDVFLSTLDGVDTSHHALELEMEGLWKRCDTGYEFSAPWVDPDVKTGTAPQVPKGHRHRRGAGTE